MSGKLMGMVWELHLERCQQLVLMAMCDHAEDDGTSSYPSVRRLAWKTNFSERSVQRALRTLESQGLIESVNHQKGGRNLPTEYHIHLEKGDKKSPYEKERVTSGTLKGDMTGERVTNGILKGDISDPKGDTQMSPEPSIEPSIEEPPSLLSRPEWFQTLSQDDRWTGKNPDKYIKAIEKEYSGVNLNLEAHGAYEWLQTPPGLKKKVLRGFWTNWLKKARSGANHDRSDSVQPRSDKDPSPFAKYG